MIWRLGIIAACIGAIFGGWWYVDHIRAENRAQAARIQALEASQRITFRQQEASDRVQIELDDLREKARARNAGLARDLADWLRNGSTCGTPAGPAASPAPASAEQPASAAAARSDGLAAICAAAAAESDERADTIAGWQRWYEELRRARQAP